MADVWVVVTREARVGLLLGALLALLVFLPITLFAGRDIATVVSLTMLVVCTLAAFVGSALPLLARRVGVDAAVMSAPFISTLVDASGLIIYFLVARLVLSL
jgi:magnesium transporter